MEHGEHGSVCDRRKAHEPEKVLEEYRKHGSFVQYLLHLLASQQDPEHKRDIEKDITKSIQGVRARHPVLTSGCVPTSTLHIICK